MISPHAKKVLIVDDDLADVYVLQRTLRHCGVRDVQSVVTAEEASQYVAGLAPFENRSLPDLIFADLKMGGVDGVQFITWLKRNPLFGKIPVVVFSGSSDPSDKDKAIQSGAKAFYKKTAQADQLKAIVETALNFNGST